MKCVTPQIVWHAKEPVLSIDFDPTTTGAESPFYRIVSGGADSIVIVWHLKLTDCLKPSLEPAAELNRHTKAVNVVRFSPDGKFIASADDDSYVFIWKVDYSNGSEIWTMDKCLRRHLEDVSDICWSSDGNYLVSSSVDNSAICWDVKKGQHVHIWSEHDGFVQGSNFDPMGEFVATMCIDKTLRLFNVKTGKNVKKALKYPQTWLSYKDDENDKKKPMSLSNSKEKDTEIDEDGKEEVGRRPINRMFHDDTLRTFFRRLHFSSKGELLLVPGGILPPQPMLDAKEKEKLMEEKKKAKKDKALANDHCAIMFCRNNWLTPCAIIPTGTEYSVVTKFCPVYFKRPFTPVDVDISSGAQLKKHEQLTCCLGSLKERKEDRIIINDPYRIVYAIGTDKSIIIGDTVSKDPLAVVQNIHFSRFTDLSWSSDGRVLLASSNDGYCSIITFEEGELGISIPKEELPVISETTFPVRPKKKKKVNRKSQNVEKLNIENEEKPIGVKNETEGTPKTPKTNKTSKTPRTPKTAKIPQASTITKTPKTPTVSIVKDEIEVLTPITPVDTPKRKSEKAQRNTLDKWLKKTPNSSPGRREEIKSELNGTENGLVNESSKEDDDDVVMLEVITNTS